MALIKCKDCGKEFSSDVKRCPNCGAKKPTSKLTWVVAVIAVIGIIGALKNNPTISPQTSNANPPPVTAGHWSYHDEQDAMRKQDTKTACTTSNNILTFNFPYNGGSTIKLCLTQSPAYGKNATITVSKGQFICNSYHCAMHMKFDNGKIITFSGGEPSDGSSDEIFIGNYPKFVNELKKSKTLTIETEFYQEGDQQINFDVSDLKWN